MSLLFLSPPIPPPCTAAIIAAKPRSRIISGHSTHFFNHTKHYYFTSNTKFKPLASTSDSASGSVSTKVPEVDLTLTLKKRADEVGPELKGTSVFLVGMNHSLKTSLGKLLADAFRYYYFDSDCLVEEAVGGRSAAKSFLHKDEKGYYDTETEVLKQLSSMGRLVVSVGNGAVQRATNLALLRHGITIWLDIPLDMIAREVVNGEIQRPLSEMSISGSYAEVIPELTALYEVSRSGFAIADTTISIQKVASELGYDALDAVSTEEVTLEVLKKIENLVRVKKMMEEAARPF